jgi:hypothetical protein
VFVALVAYLAATRRDVQPATAGASTAAQPGRSDLDPDLDGALVQVGGIEA